LFSLKKEDKNENPRGLPKLKKNIKKKITKLKKKRKTYGFYFLFLSFKKKINFFFVCFVFI
jgi:ABC-type lipoprotein release transport system permease subunit